MKVAILISSLRCGGTERTASLLANAWASGGIDVEILTLSGPEVPPFFALNSAVKHSPLDLQYSSRTKAHGLINNLRRALAIRRAFKRARPDIILAFMEGTTALALIAASGLNTPVIISEVAVPELQSAGWWWTAVRKILYPAAAALVVPSKGVQSYFTDRMRLECEVIPNPVAVPSKEDAPRSFGKRLIAVGRLSPEKGFDLLLRAFAEIKKRHPEATLSIFGEGTLRQSLLGLRDQLGLAQSVQFPGTSKDLAQELKKADLFILSSKYEGFGNVLCEAMAVGLPVVSFDCPTGPREIIRDGIDGVLVPPDNIALLTETVCELLSNREKRISLANRAPEVLTRFGLPEVSRKWQMAFHKALEAE